jgi:hypothetical protein
MTDDPNKERKDSSKANEAKDAPKKKNSSENQRKGSYEFPGDVE